MAEQIPVSEMQSAVNAAKQAHASSIKDFERNINQIIAGLSKSADMTYKATTRFSDIGALRSLENILNESKNKGLRALGTTIKNVRAVADGILALQDQYNKLRKELMLTAAASSMAGQELDDYVKEGITAESNLRSSLHITLNEWDDYLKTYRKFAVTAGDMNIQILSQGSTISRSVTEGLFNLSSRFQIDIVKVTEAYESTFTRGGPIGEDIAKGAADTLDAWRAVAYGAEAAGSSIAKAHALIADIATGTEAQVSGGARRIMGMADMYNRLFKMLKENHQQGLIEDYFKAIESGLREMSVESAALFSGAMWGQGGPGGTRNAMAAAMDFKAKVRTMIDINDPKKQPVTHMSLLQEVTTSVLNASQTDRIITMEELRKTMSPLQRKEMYGRFYAQQQVISQLAPGLSEGARWRFAAVLKAINEGGKVSRNEAKEALEAMGGEELEAKRIQDQKTNFLEQITDMLMGWSNRFLFGAPDNRAERIKNANALFVAQHGTKAEFIKQHLGDVSKMKKADIQKRQIELEKQWEDDRKMFLRNAVYKQGLDRLFSPEMQEQLKNVGASISKDIQNEIAAGRKEYAGLYDPSLKMSRSQKAALMDKALREKIKDKMESARTNEEREAIRMAFDSQAARDIMNEFRSSQVVYEEPKTLPYLGTQIRPGRETVIGFLAGEEAEEEFSEGVERAKDRAAKLRGEAKTEAPSKETGAKPPLQPRPAFIGALNTTEGEIRSLHEGEMIIPRNQADIIRSMGGPMAFLNMLGDARGMEPTIDYRRSYTSDVRGYLDAVIQSMSVLERALNTSRMSMSTTDMGADQYKFGYIIDDFLSGVNQFADGMDRAAQYMIVKRAQQGSTATEGERTTFSPWEFFFGKDAADEVKKTGGVPAAAQKAQEAKRMEIPKLLELAPSVISSVDGKMTPEQIMAFKFNIAYVESRNSYAAMNKQTTATGKYQFLIGTARGMFRQHKEMFSDLGISEADFRDVGAYKKLMMDPNRGPAVQERIMNAAVIDYAQTLKRTGLPINQETMAALHFIGPKSIPMMKKLGSKFFSSGYNPTAGTNIANTSIGKYVGTMRSMGVEAFRKAQEKGTLLSSQDESLMANISKKISAGEFGPQRGAPGDTSMRSKISSAAETVTGVASKIFRATAIAGDALSALSGAVPMLPMVTPYIIGPMANKRSDSHSITVPLVADDGTMLNANCVINFNTTTITEVADEQIT